MNTRIIVSGIILKADEILLCRKPPNQPPYPNCYHIPGGGVEDQTLVATLLANSDFNNPYFYQELQREIREETNLSVTNISCLCPTYRAKPRTGQSLNKNGEPTEYIFLEYLCHYESGEIKTGDDVAHAEWINKVALAELNLTPPSYEMFTELGWLINNV